MKILPTNLNNYTFTRWETLCKHEDKLSADHVKIGKGLVERKPQVDHKAGT